MLKLTRLHQAPREPEQCRTNLGCAPKRNSVVDCCKDRCGNANQNSMDNWSEDVPRTKRRVMRHSFRTRCYARRP